MNMMNILQVFGGLAIFIFGMKLMGDGLHRVAGERMRSILRIFSANRFIAVVTGAVATGVIQCSGATTVMVVGFVNAGLLSLVQAIGLILGAHIGTTITAQLVAFDLNWIIMPSLIIGLVFSFLPNRKISNWSNTILGLGFIFLGMTTMSSELKILSHYEPFVQALQSVNCAPVDGFMPLLPMLGALAIGTLATIAMQSSSACTGVLVALGSAGLLDIHTALLLVMGANIGTTITAQLAALTANRVAKQAALANTLSNVIGAFVIMLTFWITYDGEPVFLVLVESLSFGAALPRQIANAHTIFNVCTTLMWLPFIGLLAKLCERLLPVKETEIVYERLEPHLLNTPSIALTQTASALRKMLKKAWVMINCTLNVYNHNDDDNQKIEKQLEQLENDVDARQKSITEYLSQLMTHRLTEKESGQIPVLLHCTNDAERIGDHAAIIHSIILRLVDSNLHFSPEAEKEYDALHEMLDKLALSTIDVLADPTVDNNRLQSARLQERLQIMLEQSETKHFARISGGECNPEVGIIFLELVDEIRKISRHLENIHVRSAMFYKKFPKIRKPAVPQEIPAAEMH